MLGYQDRFPLDRLHFCVSGVSSVSIAAQCQGWRRRDPGASTRLGLTREFTHDLRSRGEEDDYVSSASPFFSGIFRETAVPTCPLRNVSASFSTPALNIDHRAAETNEGEREGACVVKTNIGWLCYLSYVLADTNVRR